MMNNKTAHRTFQSLNAPKFLLSHSESVSTVLISCDIKPYTVGLLAKFGDCKFHKAHSHERFLM